MNEVTAKIVAAVVASILLVLIVVFVFVYRYFTAKRTGRKAQDVVDEKPKERSIRRRPTPLKLNEIRYQRVPSQFTPLVITPTTPSHFTIPTLSNAEDGRASAFTWTPSTDGKRLSPSARFGNYSPLKDSPKLLRTMSEGHGSAEFKAGRVPPHGKLECFLKYEEELKSLLVQVMELINPSVLLHKMK